VSEATPPLEGGCSCREVRYRLRSEPMIVNCCHCTWCQRETGSAFVLNAVIERDRLELLAGAPRILVTPSASGLGQKIARCPSCQVALFSHYAGAGEKAAFVRVGTLDAPERCPPDVHIFTSTKQPWVTLPAGARAFTEFYELARVWRPESLARRTAMLG